MAKAILALIIALIPICCKGLNFSQEISPELFGSSIDFGEPRFTFATTRSFNGDGYTLDVLAVNPTNKDLLQNLLAGKLSEYPKKPDYREEWQATHWRRTPARATERVYIDFAAASYDPDNLQLEHYLREFSTELATRGSYYAYFYLLHKSSKDINIGNIDFFLYCPRKSLLFIINHNT